MSSFILLLSLTISFTLISSSTTADGTPTQEASASPMDLVTLTCESTPNQDLCQHTINADTKSPKKDINDLAFITFDAASTKSVENIEFITRANEATEAGGHPEEKQMFHDCEQEYEGAVDDIDNSVNYLASRTKEDDKQIDGLLKDAIAAINTCQKNVMEKGPKGDQLVKLNQELIDLLNNALAVFHVIK